ncbi:MAG: phage minor capsid protein [Lachnospiraceae bacterium]|nr:phage minor capsid protein [Lachnospiraceae bacterium]
MADDYDIAAAVRRIEDEVIASMIRNLDHHRAEEDKEGINWEQWQVKQLAALEEFKKRNAAKYGDIFDDINARIETLIKIQRAAGYAEQEIAILKALQKGAKLKKVSRRQAKLNARFFLANDRKINALIQATTADMQKAEYAILRMANDKYRKIIFDAQMHAASGAGTYETAVDMATKDFLRAGINCVEYSNGARHTASDYVDMAIRTASKRAYLTGEGESRRERGITTVIMNKRGNACPKCLPFVGKVLIDDVWSGGSSRDGPYPLMSTAIAAGLYHPRCKDIHSTYFPGISTPPDDVFTKEELADIEAKAKKEAERQYAKRQAESCDRLAKYSLDENNRKTYAERAREWKRKYDEGHVLADSTDEWDMTAKEELLKDERVLSNREKETAVVYDKEGKFLFQQRGNKREVQFSVSQFFRLRGNIVTHNHPSGCSFSAKDISLLKNGGLAELRVIVEGGVFFARPPKKWSKDINSLKKIKKIMKDIRKDVAQSYKSVYTENNINQIQSRQMISDEVIRIFSERYGLEYGWEPFKD